MAQPTLEQIFGTGAIQDADSVTIDKAALATVGLTANANNAAEALLNAIFRVAAKHLTAANLDLNPDQSIVIGTPSNSTDDRLNATYFVQNFTIGFQKLIANTDVMPGDM